MFLIDRFDLTIVLLPYVLFELRLPHGSGLGKMGSLSVGLLLVVKTHCDMGVKLDFFFYFKMVLDQTISLRNCLVMCL